MKTRMSGRASVAVALVVSSAILLAGMQLRPAVANHVNEVTAVNGLAYNYFTNVSLFGGPYNRRGYGQDAAAPAAAASPSVTCPAGGGSPSATDADGAKAQYGPAVIFGGKWPADQASAPPSGPLTSSVACQLGAGGHVTASTGVTLMPAGSAYPGGAGPGPFIADEVHSTCTARADGTNIASTNIVNGILETSYDPVTQEPVTTEPIPTNPAPNYTRTGTIDHVGDNYRIVFNEQTVNADGSITVNAAHMYLLGPTAVGDMVIGSSTCGPLTTAPIPDTTTTTTPGSSTTTTVPASTTTTTAAATTTTTVPSSTTTTTVPPTTTTTTAPAPAGSVTGRAFGYFTNVGLFGGAQTAKGPAPTVTLPAEGSPAPVTATEASGIAQYGPAVLFKSGQINVSTQGMPGASGSVTSSARIAGVADGPGPFLYKEVSSTCTATESGTTGSTSITDGVLETKYDVNTQDPVTTVALAASPAPNTELLGTIDHVGDRFRIVFNEQTKNPDGSLRVNAAHMYLLGPIAVGEMIIGQSVCGKSALSPSAAAQAAASAPAGSADTDSARPSTAQVSASRSSGVLPSAGATASTGLPSALSRTGAPVADLVVISMLFLAMGGLLVAWSRRRAVLAVAGTGGLAVSHATRRVRAAIAARVSVVAAPDLRRPTSAPESVVPESVVPLSAVPTASRRQPSTSPPSGSSLKPRTVVSLLLVAVGSLFVIWSSRRSASAGG